MSSSQPDSSAPAPAILLWPGVLLVSLQLFFRFGVTPFIPGFTGSAMLSSLAMTLLVLCWWLFLSRAPLKKRWGGFLVLILCTTASYPLVHKSISSGMMGIAVILYSTPFLCLVLVLWAATANKGPKGLRYLPLIIGCALITAGLSLLRTDGMRGEDGSDFAWRWEKTPEELMLAEGDEVFAAMPELAEVEALVDTWSGFRGPNRDSIVPDTHIDTDWTTSPPTKLWSRAVGPAWSSFAVRGDSFFTQEQRGDVEVVSCYRVSTGEPVWRHEDSIRFWESNAGAGPRATPTLHGEVLFTLGATGHLNALKVIDGTAIWSRDAAVDADAEVPEWGFSSSPLVVGNLVIVAMPGTLMAYGTSDGELRWTSEPGEQSYGSPHLLTLDGVEQVLLMRQAEAISVSAKDGTTLWKYPLKGVPCVQPALCPNGDVLLGGGQGEGVTRVSVKNAESGWTVDEVWHSRRLKPYFNDYAIFLNWVFGFDGSMLACIDLETGERLWKGGRYGYGQFLLLKRQAMMIVITEQGDLALVESRPDSFTEVARVPGIEGKTWNLPVLAGDVLLVRNDKEMAAFRLATIDE